MLDASATLDGLEALLRDPANTQRTRTLVSGICRIDVELVQGVTHWRTNGLTCSRQSAVDALENARAAKAV